MNKEAVYHRMNSEYARAIEPGRFLVRLRTAKNDAAVVTACIYDKYRYFNPETKKKYEKVMEKVASDLMYDYYEAVFDVNMNSIYYYFKLEGNETLYYSSYRYFKDELHNPSKFFLKSHLYDDDLMDIPEWAKEAVVYQIFPERFYSDKFEINGISDEWYKEIDHKSFLGGNIEGIISKLDYIKELGTNVIYLTPVFLSDSNHKYNIFDYYTIDPEFGDKETLKKLVEEAHKRGIKVILDAVFNHCGVEFFAFEDVIENGEESKYKNWFDIKSFPVKVESNPQYATFGYFRGMPKILTQNSDAAEYLIDVAKYWIRETDIDGWRLDVADEVEHSFWRKFREAVRKEKSDVLIIGEIWTESLAWLRGDQFDTVMNYPFFNSLNGFINGELTASEFADFYGFLRGTYANEVMGVLWNLVGSHDTQRFMTTVNNDMDKFKLGIIMLLTFEGTPMLYYGDEVGMTGGRDPDNRRGMFWGGKQDSVLLEFYKKLISFRINTPALCRGNLRFVVLDDDKKVVGFVREHEGRKVMTVINNGAEEYCLSNEGYTKELLSGEEIAENTGYTVKPHKGVILYRE